MPAELFLDGRPMSELGRSSAMTLNSLRRQLGPGVDPAFDYTKLLEESRMHKQKAKAKAEQGRSGPAPPTGPLAELEKALREAAESAGGAEAAGAAEASRASVLDSGVLNALEKRKARNALRPSAAFKSQSWSELYEHEVSNQFRPPPIGAYRVKDQLVLERVRVPDFGFKPKTKGRHIMARDAEIERRKANGEPVDHLLKTSVSVEHLTNPPEGPKPSDKTLNFSAYKERQPMASGEFQINTFTAGVLDGDMITSNMHRIPSFDFGKAAAPREKPQHSFFQPGQYKPNLDAIKDRSDRCGMGFEKQSKRKPMILERAKDGDSEIPDRSLFRKCAAVSDRIQVRDISKMAHRKGMEILRAPDYDTSDPNVVEAVYERQMNFDLSAAERGVMRKAKSAENFDKVLRRDQANFGTRQFGQDAGMMKARHAQDVTSTETLPMERISPPCVQPRVIGRDFLRMCGRGESERIYVEEPPRRSANIEQARFQRDIREGESRAQVGRLSALSEEVTAMRRTRNYDALPMQQLT